MIERLIHSLQALAAPADVQLARFPDSVAKADEIARDFADALLLATDCPQLQLSRGQRDALARLEGRLDRMSGPANAHAWTEQAVRSGPEWEAVRGLARDALAVLGAPSDPSTPGSAACGCGRAT